MKILVAGCNGQVAQALLATAGGDLSVVALGRPTLDIQDRASLERAIAQARPDIVVNAAAYTAVDQAERESEAAFAANRDGARNVAAAAAAADLPIIHISTDYVFSGDKAAPYTETDPTGPIGVYGRSKLKGEEAVAAANPAHVILRTAWVYSLYGRNFLKTMLHLATERDVVRVVADQHGTPTSAADIAQGTLIVARRALEDPQGRAWRGVFHMVAQGETTWAGFAEEIFRRSMRANGPRAKIESILTTDYPTPAKRPMNSRLSTMKFRNTFRYDLPEWAESVGRCLNALEIGKGGT